MPILKRTLLQLSLILIIQMVNTSLLGQEVPHNISNTGIYEFLDELANNQIISINSAIKPYSRLFIALKLKEADGKKEKLNPREQKELDFYLRDFGKESNKGNRGNRGFSSILNKKSQLRRDLFYYQDSLFSLTINPIFGGEIFNNSSGNATYWRNGAEARGYIKHWGFYASLRDNHETPLLGLPVYLTQREGGHLKEGNAWEEMLGGVTYSWKWGSAGLVKDKLQ
jgi:hypothetical protein